MSVKSTQNVRIPTALLWLGAVAALFLSVLSAPTVATAATSGDSVKAISFGGTCAEDPNRRGTNKTICYADDANMDFCTPKPWPTVYGNQLMSAMATLDSQTDMYDTYRATCTGQTDIGGSLNASKEISLVGTDYRGIALCTKPIGGWGKGVCDQGSLVVNTGLTGSGAQFRKTVCHEVGHFAGLHHYSAPGAIAASCMVSGSSTINSYSPAERSAINGRY